METVPPDVTNAMRQLETQAALSMVLAEVRSLRDQLEGIRIGLQNDRLALAEGAWDKLMQAREVEDSRLRDALIMQALSSATDAKRTLMRNFTQNANYLIEQSEPAGACETSGRISQWQRTYTSGGCRCVR